MRLPDLAKVWPSRVHPTRRSGAGFVRIEEQGERSDAGGWTELQHLGSDRRDRRVDTLETKNEWDKRASIDTTTTRKTARAELPIRSRRWYTQGWRFGAINCACSVTIVFFINFIVSCWGSAHKNTGSEVVFQMDCHRVSKMNSYLHFGINLLSTVLLSSSNYVMQCLSAPTRSEVNAAHARGIWLDIGIPSMRNLRHINRKRVYLWGLLGLSSVPLHLFYNSMIYSSIASHDYYAFSVNQQFLDDAECVNCSYNGTTAQSTIGTYSYMRQVAGIMHDKWKQKKLDRLENKDCITQYATMIQSFRRNILLVSSNDHTNATSKLEGFNGTHVYYHQAFAAIQAQYGEQAIYSYDWMCKQAGNSENSYDAKESSDPGWCANQIDKIKSNATNWTVQGYPVEYCLSEPAPPLCRLHIFLPIAWLVTVLNSIKGFLILYTVFKIKDEPLMTMGDAVSSFLEEPDPTTKNLCLLTQKDAKAHTNFFPVGPKAWNDTKYRWKDVTSRGRRITTYTLFGIALLVVFILLIVGIVSLKNNEASISLPALVKLGFGSITMSNILVANLAQPILSFLYFAYNGLFTCMLLGHEWSQFAHHRKGLRVSRGRHGAQRSTYFLQLPYRYSLPLMTLSGVLHWLVSQSIFLVAIDTYDETETAATAKAEISSNNDGWKSCGYSPIAIICVLILGSLMVVAGIAAGRIPYKPGMNLAGSCSAAMSAACHHEEWDGVDGHESARSKLQWGVVGTAPGDGIGYGEVDAVGHCTFSSKEVSFPEKGKLYAGKIKTQ